MIGADALIGVYRFENHGLRGCSNSPKIKLLVFSKKNINFSLSNDKACILDHHEEIQDQGRKYMVRLLLFQLGRI